MVGTIIDPCHCGLRPKSDALEYFPVFNLFPLALEWSPNNGGQVSGEERLGGVIATRIHQIYPLFPRLGLGRD